MAAIAVPIQRIDKTLDMPAYAYPGDAGLDLRAAEAAVLKPFVAASKWPYRVVTRASSCREAVWRLSMVFQ